MANQATITSLVAAVRRRMNMTSLNTISDSELQLYVQEALASLYEILVSRWRDYYVQRSTISLTANTEAYPLPPDFRAISAVYLVFAQQPNSRRVPLMPFNMNQLTNFPSAALAQPQWPAMYRVMGDKIWFTPVSTQNYNNAIEIWYVPQWNPPISNSAPIDYVLPNGWEQWVMLEVCVQVSARMRLAEFYQMFAAERKLAEQRVIAAASVRDENPLQMTDIYDTYDGFWFLGTPGTG